MIAALSVPLFLINVYVDKSSIKKWKTCRQIFILPTYLCEAVFMLQTWKSKCNVTYSHFEVYFSVALFSSLSWWGRVPCDQSPLIVVDGIFVGSMIHDSYIRLNQFKL